MRTLDRVTEHKMVSVFLKAEIDSPRWGQHILRLLDQAKKPRSLVDTPDLDSDQENGIRTWLLGFRGYKQNNLIFAGFPHAVEWYTSLLDVADLKSLKVMNQEPWIQFSGGSRIAWDAAQNFISGKETHEVKIDISNAMKHLTSGTPFPEIILVGESLESNLVVLEGHVRLMALLMSEREVETAAIVGVSTQMSKWRFF